MEKKQEPTVEEKLMVYATVGLLSSGFLILLSIIGMIWGVCYSGNVFWTAVATGVFSLIVGGISSEIDDKEKAERAKKGP